MIGKKKKIIISDAYIYTVSGEKQRAVYLNIDLLWAPSQMQILFHSKPESARRNSQCALLPKCQTNKIMIFKRKAKRDDAAQHSTILYTQSNTPRVCHKITNKNIPVRWVGYIAIIYILMAYIETKSSVCLESIFWPNVNHFLSRVDYAQIPLEKVYIQIPRQTGIPLLYIRIYVYIKWKYGLYLLEQLPFNSFFFFFNCESTFLFFFIMNDFPE